MNRTLLWVLVGALVLFVLYRMRQPVSAPPAEEPPEESLIDAALRRLREATRRIGLDEEADMVYYDAPAPGITRRSGVLSKQVIIPPSGGGKGPVLADACCASCARR